MHLTVSARFLISSGRGGDSICVYMVEGEDRRGTMGGEDFTALVWLCNIMQGPDN